MKKIFTIFVLTIIMFSVPVYAETKTNGVRTFVSGHEFKPPNFAKERYDYFWFSTSYLWITEVSKNFEYSHGLGMGLIGARESSAPFVEYRLLGKFKYEGVYVQVGGGFSHGFNADDIPHITDTPLYGLISGEIGYEFSNGISIGYTWEHISSPFHDDSGMNVGGIAITIKF